MRPFLLTLLTTSALVLAACGDDEEPASPAVASTPAAATSPTTPAGADVAVTEGECADVPAPAAKDTETPEPKGSLDASKRNIVTLKTSCGTIRIELDAKDNPKTANSFATMSKNGYYDGLGFHRTVKGFVIQGGDPAGNGSGGPSWKVVEAPPADTKYTAGVVAMAKTGDEAPGTSGSQFFIVTGADVGLPAEYAVAGKVVKGQKIADAIADLAEEGVDGPPSKPVAIFSATFTEE